MVSTLVSLPAQHGGYLSNCQAHCPTGSGSWTSMTVGGAFMGESFVSWYNATVRGAPPNPTAHRHYETCGVKPCGADKC